MTHCQAFARRNHFPAPVSSAKKHNVPALDPGSGATQHAYAVDTTQPRPNHLRAEPINTTSSSTGWHPSDHRLLKTCQPLLLALASRCLALIYNVAICHPST
jgi:hypothetical protein